MADESPKATVLHESANPEALNDAPDSSIAHEPNEPFSDASYWEEHATFHIEADSLVSGKAVHTAFLGANLSLVAHNLFSAMRRLDDDLGVDVIFAQCVSDLHEGRAVMDRLQRAAVNTVTV